MLQRNCRGSGLAIGMGALLFALSAAVVAQSETVEDSAIASKSETEAFDSAGTIERLMNFQTPLSEEELVAAEAAFKSQCESDPKNTRAMLGSALVLFAQSKPKEARDIVEQAIEIDSSDPDLHYVRGNCCFTMLNGASVFDMPALSKKGRGSYEQAIKLDPEHLGANIGLASFYLFAPGIAGGDEAKGREIATKLTTLPGGGVMGHLLLAQVEGREKNWNEADRHYAEARKAADTVESRTSVDIAQAGMLITERKEYGLAIDLLTECLSEDASDSTQGWYFLGNAHKAQGNCEEAVKAYEKVLALNEEAQNTRFSIAECLESLGELETAKRHFEEFITRFPKDDRVKAAKKAIKRLSK